MDNTVPTKADLWEERIRDFNESGLSRKQWCNDHQIALSTFSYWMRKHNENTSIPVLLTDAVFARLPSVQEIGSASSPDTGAPVTIYLSENIRIEIGINCTPGLMSSLIRTVKAYA